MGEVVRFRRNRRLAFVMIASLMLMCAGFGVLTADVAAREEPLPTLVAMGVMFSVVILVVVRILLMQVEFDDAEVRMRGVLYRLRVPRDRVRGIRNTGVAPMLEWVDARGRTRGAPVDALYGNGLLDRLAPGEAERRAEFVSALGAWAEGGAGPAAAGVTPGA